MSKSQKTIRIDDEDIAQVETLALKERRTFSAMAAMLLRDGLNSREGFAPYKKRNAPRNEEVCDG